MPTQCSSTSVYFYINKAFSGFLGNMTQFLLHVLIKIIINNKRLMYGSTVNSGLRQTSLGYSMSSQQIYQFIKKKPFTQHINGVEYTYSILCKKRQTFLFGNDRFLLLKGIESLSYARELSPTKKLPFQHAAEMPQAKATFSLSDIQNFTNEQEQLIVTFSGDKRKRWEFVCPSKHCALEWRNKLDQAMQRLNQFKMSSVSNREDLLRNNSMVSQLTEHNHQIGNMIRAGLNSTFATQYNELNNSKNNVQYQPYNESQNSSLLSNPVQMTHNSSLNKTYNQSPNKEQQGLSLQLQSNNKEKEVIQQTKRYEQNLQGNSLHGQEHPKILQHLSTPPKRLFPNRSKKSLQEQNYNPKSPNRPNAVLFRGSTAAKVDNFIIQHAHEHSSQSQQQISNVSPQSQLKIRKQILKLQRNWVQQLIQNKQQVALVMNFKNYVQKIGEVIVNQLPKENGSRIFPHQQIHKDYAVYMLEDLEVEIYFLSEEHLVEKNRQYRRRAGEFKNYDYLLGATRNEGMLIVPLMAMFEFKGFMGMAKNRIRSTSQYCNKMVYEMMDRHSFQFDTRVKAEVLLNQTQCNIVAVETQNEVKTAFNQSSVVYFVEQLTELLPTEEKNTRKLFRPELVQGEEMQDKLFGDELNSNGLLTLLLQRKINAFVNALQSQEQYFTNPKQLAQLIHSYGLNIRHIGLIFKKVKQGWLRDLIKADIVARSLKNYFRYDIQNVVQDKSGNAWERHQERQARRVISFLNIVLGNSQASFRMWRNVNSYSQYAYDMKVWQNEYEDVNVPFLLLALQTHLKIVLSSDILTRPYFKSMETLQVKDFIRFEFDCTFYNLDFTQLFQDIHDCLDEESFDSFHTLCEILTKESPSNVSYFQLLKNHAINDEIREFLFEFTSPQDNYELYSRVQSKSHPSQLVYSSKLAQIRWCFKSQKYQHISAHLSFMEGHVGRWFGSAHPILTQLYRTLAEYYSQLEGHYSEALKYATSSIGNQQALLGGECQYLWKDYFLLGKIHYINNRFMESTKFLFKGKELVKVQKLVGYEVYAQMLLILSKCYLALRYYKESYTTVKELYRLIRDKREERILLLIIQSVALIKQLLQLNQQHESYQRFIENDFSQIVSAFGEYPQLMGACIKMIALPNLKKVILRNNKNKAKLLSIIDEISKIPQPRASCEAYFRGQIKQGSFPRNYLKHLKEMDSVLEEIEVNHMMERWKSFNQMTNQSILEKITGSINRGFQFMANMTALFNYLGQQALTELFIMEK